MNPRRSPASRSLLLAMVTTVSIAGGCAVLTIDVDVYKGPLANHEDVQLEQLVAMAIGARPILLELMNKLEGTNGENLDELLADYVPPRPDGKPALKDSGARRVNAILGLYRNRSVLIAKGETAVDEPLRKLIEAAQAQLTAYQQAYGVLNGDLSETWKNDIAPGLKEKVVPDGEAKDISDPVGRLTRLAYDFFNPRGGYRYDGEDWTKIHAELRDAKVQEEHKLQGTAISDLDPKTVFGVADGKVDQGANAGFLALSREGGALEAYSELLFKPNAKAARETFVTKARNVAKAFLDAREARSRLLAILLDGLSGADPESTDPKLDPDVKPEDTDTGSTDSGRIALRERARREAADVAVELLQPKHTLAVLTLARYKSVPVARGEDVTVPDAIRNLRIALLERTAASKSLYDPPRGTWNWTDVNVAWAVVSKRLREALVERPRETAATLAAADTFFKSRAFRYPEVCKRAGLEAKYASRNKRTYGLSSGPLDGLSRAEGAARELGIQEKKKDEASELEIEEKAKRLLATGSVGLGEGRLEKGLETLIEEYLNARKDCLTNSAGRSSDECRNDPKVRGARETLLEALVRFAEKVLVIANNDVLLREPQERRAAIIPGILWGTVTNILGCRSIEPQDPYPLVLQAVGNSILVQADELRQRRSHQAKLRDRVENEVRALNSTLPPDASATADPSSDARKVLDALIAALEYQRLEAIKAGGEDSAMARQLTSSLAAAYEYRSGMVYIRPPWAYLRTSYPSTSLQSDPDLRWRNMLGENAGRGLPFSGEVRDYFYPEGVINAKTVADIDKQFWQSINRVRVNGVGNTNYAVAKDDIGNWYLKTYSTDPKDIIRSARNLALFGAGAAAGANVLQNLPHQEKIEGMLSSKTATNPSVTEATFRRFQSDYDTKSEQDFKALSSEIDRLPSRVRAAWTAGGLDAGPADPLGRILDQTSPQLRVDTPGGDKVEHGVEVLRLLRGVRRFRSVVVAGITDNASDRLSPEKKRSARAIADRETRALVERYLDRRRRSVEQYHAAIVNFGAGPADPD